MGKKVHRPPVPELSLTPAVEAPPLNEDDDADAERYEAVHVHQVYDAIAPHFSLTRHKPWPRVSGFLEALSRGALIADVGCGNGKYVAAARAAGHTVVGVERCRGLCTASTAAAGKGSADAAVGDCLAIPLRTGAFDAALSIAVVHHVRTRARRVAAWRELARVLRPGGLALAFVWARERPEALPEPRRAKRMLTRTFAHPEMLVPWHLRERKAGAEDDRILGDPVAVFRRYYHIYSKGELECEWGDVAGVRVVDSYFAHQNWAVVVQKVAHD